MIMHTSLNDIRLLDEARLEPSELFPEPVGLSLSPPAGLSLRGDPCSSLPIIVRREERSEVEREGPDDLFGV